MTWKNTTARYGWVSIGLHWLMLALLIGVYACINLADLFAKGGAPRDALKDGHFMLGLTVLLLVAVRLLNRLVGGEPAVVPPLAVWQARLAGLTHLALYGLMIVTPILGWLLLSAAGKPIAFFGVELPSLLGQDKALAGQLKEVHETLGTAGYFLIGAHALAALFHHYIVRDNTLLRILPGHRS